jgi:hypothetical protein
MQLQHQRLPLQHQSLQPLQSLCSNTGTCQLCLVALVPWCSAAQLHSLRPQQQQQQQHPHRPRQRLCSLRQQLREL